MNTIEQTSTTPTSQSVTPKIKEQWGRIVAIVSLVAIALGGFNDTMDAVEKIYDFSLSQLTDIPSQNKLDKIYIRASSDSLEENFGAPIYIKKSYSGEVIQYYRDDRFILSTISKDDAIAAYLVFPRSSFNPDTSASSGGDDLLSTPFEHQEGVSDIKASVSRSVTYYIEENSAGEFSNLYSSVAGYTEIDEILDNTKRILLSSLTDKQVLGDDDISVEISAIRKHLAPNFYGYSNLGLSSLEEAILTKSEYALINK